MSTAGGLTVGVVLGAPVGRGPMERRIYKKFSTLTLFGTHCANGSQSWGDPRTPGFVRW